MLHFTILYQARSNVDLFHPQAVHVGPSGKGSALKTVLFICEVYLVHWSHF